MFTTERHQAILRLLDSRQRLDIHALLAHLKISPATLRRDLAHLERSGRLVRVHGGILHPSLAPGEPSFVQRSRAATAAKRSIAAAAIRLVPANATVFIDGGTTCLEIGQLLRDRADLTLITNSLPLLAGFYRFRARLLVLGGEMRAVSAALVGDLTLAALGQLRADISFIGASGLDPADGPGTTELSEKAVKAEWLRRSRRRILVCDATKWNQSAVIPFAAWTDFSDFVTDIRPPNRLPRPLRVHLA